MQHTVSRTDISATDIRILRARGSTGRPPRRPSVHPRPLTRSYTRMAAAKATYIRKLEATTLIHAKRSYKRINIRANGSYKYIIYA